MGKLTLGVAIAGIATSIALAVRSQIADTHADKIAASAPAGARPDSAPSPDVQPAGAPASQPAPAPQDTSRRPVKQPAPQEPARQPPRIERAPHPPIVENAENFQVRSAAEVLTSAAAAYKKLQSSRADFVLRRTNPLLGSTTTSRGRLYQKRPDRFLMKFAEPAGDIIVSDGRYFWIYYPSADARQVLRAPASQGAGGVDLQAQFLGDPMRRFSNTFHGIEPVNGRKAYVYTLTPRNRTDYKSLKVWIDTRDYLARRFILTENNGVVQDFTLSNLALNPALEAGLFRFTPPANARIVERT